jgi:hypothetical protein
VPVALAALGHERINLDAPPWSENGGPFDALLKIGSRKVGPIWSGYGEGNFSRARRSPVSPSAA